MKKITLRAFQNYIFSERSRTFMFFFDIFSTHIPDCYGLFFNLLHTVLVFYFEDSA